MRTAHYSLHRLDFFQLDVKKVCDLSHTNTLQCVCNSINFVDVIDKIVEIENAHVQKFNSTAEHKYDYEFSQKDIYVTTTDWLNDECEEYAIAYEFVQNHKILAVFGVDADETDMYLLVVEYTD